MSLLDTTQLSLQAAMRGSMLDQTLLSNDLANVDTPGYQEEGVNFQGTLATAMDAGRSPSSVQFTPYTVGGSESADGNNVDAEQTSADIAENGLLYQDLTEVAATRNQILVTAIGSPGAGS